MKPRLAFAVAASVLSLSPAQSASPLTPSDAEYSRSAASFQQTLGDLIAADTANPPGNEARATSIIAKRLKAEGVPYEIVTFANGRNNLVARLKGSGEKKPLLLLAHIDVVGTDQQNWSTPPHVLTEKDGYLYGRGANDDLSMAVANLETMILLKRSQAPLKRDVIAAFTGDEESGGAGVRFLLAHRPELIDAEVAFNEGGGVVLTEPVAGADQRVQYVGLQAAEKIYQDFEIAANGPTGHSSIPKDGNAIDRLARALVKIAASPASPRLIPVTREFFAASANLESPPLADAMRQLARAKGSLPKKALAEIAKKPELAALLQTTCVPTMVKGGARENALPARASANLNCRIMPDETPAQTRARLISFIGDSGVEVNYVNESKEAAPKATQIGGEFFNAVKRASARSFPGAPIIPVLVSGATDSRFLRAHGIEAYGLSPIAQAISDGSRDHGVDERINVSSIRPGLEYMYRLTTEVAQ